MRAPVGFVRLSDYQRSRGEECEDRGRTGARVLALRPSASISGRTRSLSNRSSQIKEFVTAIDADSADCSLAVRTPVGTASFWVYRSESDRAPGVHVVLRTLDRGFDS